MPPSSAASTTAAVPAASVRQPTLLHPTPTRDTLRDPMLRYSMNVFLYPLAAFGGVSPFSKGRIDLAGNKRNLPLAEGGDAAEDGEGVAKTVTRRQQPRSVPMPMRALHRS